jgi:hypothetical protein
MLTSASIDEMERTIRRVTNNLRRVPSAPMSAKELMRGNWTSVGSMYLRREIPLFFLLFSNPHSSNNIRRRRDISHLFWSLAGITAEYLCKLMKGNWTSVGSMYLGREIPLFFLLLSNPHSSKTIQKTTRLSSLFSSLQRHLLSMKYLR